MEKNSFEMAYEELKAAGKTTVNGKEIQLLFEDDQGKQDVAKSATEKLVNQDKVAMLSGGYSSACTNVIAGSAQALNMPFWLLPVLPMKLPKKAGSMFSGVRQLPPASTPEPSGK